MLKKTLYYLRIPLTIAFLAFLLYNVGIDELISALGKSDPLYQIPLLAIWLVSQFLGTLALFVLVRPLKMTVSFWKIFRRFIVTWSLAFATPARAGEFLMAAYFKRDGLPIGRGIVVIFIDKLATLVVTLLIAIAGAHVLLGPQVSAVLIALLIAGLLLALMISKSERAEEKIEGFFARRFGLMSGGYSQMRSFLSEHRVALGTNLLITVVKFLTHAGFLWLVFLSINVTPPLYMVFLISALVQVVILVPITISGLGLREGATVVLFSLAGVEASDAFAAAIMCSVLAYVYAGLSLLIFPWEKPTKSLSEMIDSEKDMAI
jgi:uncharacterized protein (TIRG00374 family)